MDESVNAFVEQPSARPWPPPWPEGCPQPGILFDVPMAEYRSWPAMNFSTLILGYSKTPWHMKAAMEGLVEPWTDPMRFGTAMHERLLRPADYRTTYKLATRCRHVMGSTSSRPGELCNNPPKRYDAEADQWYCGIKGHATSDAETPELYVDESEAARIERIVEEVQRSALIRLLRSHGGCEVCYVWERDGLPCKARVDKAIQGARCPVTFLDLKGVRPGGGTDSSWAKTVYDRNYDAQFAWYDSGRQYYKQGRLVCLWVILETSEPYGNRVVEWDAPWRKSGQDKINAAWDGYLHGMKTGHWIGYPETITRVDPPNWVAKRHGIDLQ